MLIFQFDCLKSTNRQVQVRFGWQRHDMINNVDVIIKINWSMNYELLTRLKSDSKQHSDSAKTAATQSLNQPLPSHSNESTMFQSIQLSNQVMMHHFQIACKIASETSSSDKLVRLMSATFKLIKAFSLISNFKRIEKLQHEIAQLRRLLRVNRFFSIVKDYMHDFQKEKRSALDIFLIFFKMIMVVCDFNDLLCYLMQLGVFKERWMMHLRRNTADLYFIESVGWLFYQIYLNWKSRQKQEGLSKSHLLIIKYALDCLTSFNDFSQRTHTLDVKLIAVIGLMSSLLNLCLIWK